MPAGRPHGTFKRLHPTRINGKVTKTYHAWQGMIARCHNPNAANFRHYGANGIAVCAEWRDKAAGYDNFVQAVGVAPVGLWLDRIDNARGYEPGNVHWVTPRQSASNRRQGGKLNIDPTSLRQRSIAAGLAYHVVYQRVKLRGWTAEKALTTPTMKRGQYQRQR